MGRVDRTQIRALEPGLVARNAVARVEDHAREVVSGERYALLRQPRPHRVHGLEAGQHPVDPAEVLLDLRDARIALEARTLGRRPGVHHLPGHRHAIRGVLRQQLVQDRGARARQADHEHGLADRSLFDFRMPHARVVHAQAVLEQTQQIAPREHAAERREVRLGLERNEQTAQRLAEARVAEIRRDPCAASPARAAALQRGSRTAARPSAAPSRSHRTRATRRAAAARRRSPRPPPRGSSPAAPGPPAHPRATHCAAGAGVTLDSGRAARPDPDSDPAFEERVEGGGGPQSSDRG